MKDYKYAVFIGRFQPLHNGHVEAIQHGLSIADKVIIFVGSVNSAPTIKNPFSFEDRKKMILNALCPVKTIVTKSKYGEQSETTVTETTEAHGRLIILDVRDYHYNYNSWLADIQGKTDQYIQSGDSVALLGSYKDSSSYYLKSFPQWDFVPVKQSFPPMDATDIRKFLFSVPTDRDGVTDAIKYLPDLSQLETEVPTNVLEFLQDYVKHYPYRDMVLEYAHILKYKLQWQSAPFPPTFVTADAVVICSGHVLVVKRKFEPGKGLYALPGGFIKQNETIRDAALRELKEETGIRIEKIILESSIKEEKVFDYPERSLRGRTITHGFYIKLKDGKLPEVRGNDDADTAFWMPLSNVFQQEHKFFEDHVHIIQHFVSKV